MMKKKLRKIIILFDTLPYKTWIFIFFFLYSIVQHTFYLMQIRTIRNVFFIEFWSMGWISCREKHFFSIVEKTLVWATTTTTTAIAISQIRLLTIKTTSIFLWIMQVDLTFWKLNDRENKKSDGVKIKNKTWKKRE